MNERELVNIARNYESASASIERLLKEKVCIEGRLAEFRTIKDTVRSRLLGSIPMDKEVLAFKLSPGNIVVALSSGHVIKCRLVSQPEMA